MASEPLKSRHRIKLGEGFELDPHSDELYRADRVFKLERIPATLLLLLVEKRGQVVRREEIVERVWGKGAFLDTDNSINGAIRKVRQALKDDPESPRFIQTISGRGYRFVGQPVAIDSAVNLQPTLVSSPPPGISSPGGPTSETESGDRKRPFNRGRVLLATIALVVVASLGLLLIRSGRKHTAGSPIKSLGVLPLKNLSGDSAQEYLADGMTEALIGRLAGIRDLRVISRTSMMSFKDTQLSVPDIARQLGVDAIVEGSVIREGSRIRVHAQLIRGATDEHFWSETYDRELRDVLSLESEVAQSIAAKVEVTVTGKERERLTAVRTVSPEVYESYLKGQFTLDKSNNRTEIEESIGYFEEAIKRDPSFAPAYLGLASSYGELSTIFIGAPPETWRPKVMTAVQRALELDPESAEAHIIMGDMQRLQWQWSQAEAEYRRALELNPNNAAAHLGLAQWLLCQGRAEEALASARRGRELDPLAVSGTAIGWILFSARRYDEAIHEYHSVLALSPDDAGTLWYLGFALIANGQPEQAIPVLEQAVSVSDHSPGVIGVLVRAYAHAGRRTDALRLLAELKRRKQAGYVPAAAFVNAYLGLGEYDQALAWLDQASREHSNILLFLKVHPYFDPLRGDPRFRDLVRRVGLD